MGKLQLQNIVLNILGAVKGVLHAPVFNFKLSLKNKLPLYVVLRGIVPGTPQLIIIKHACNRRAPIYYQQLLLKVKGIEADVINPWAVPAIRTKIDAGKIGTVLCLAHSVPVDHRRDAQRINLAQGHLTLKNFLGVAFIAVLHHVALCFAVFLVHFFNRALCFCKLQAGLFYNLLKMDALFRKRSGDIGYIPVLRMLCCSFHINLLTRSDPFLPFLNLGFGQ